jgi:hypothetical protein
LVLPPTASYLDDDMAAAIEEIAPRPLDGLRVAGVGLLGGLYFHLPQNSVCG